MPDSAPQWILWPLSVIASLFIGGFLKSYMGKKGENLATHEDIGKLVEQMSRVTEATKKIEAKISDEVLTRQRNRDVKREVMFELVKELSTLQYNTTRFSAAKTVALAAKSDPDAAERKKATDLLSQETIRYQEQLDSFWKCRALATVVCNQPFLEKLETIERIGSVVWARILENQEHDGQLQLFGEEIRNLAPFIRAELEIG
jgi:hypothetical protein